MFREHKLVPVSHIHTHTPHRSYRLRRQKSPCFDSSLRLERRLTSSSSLRKSHSKRGVPESLRCSSEKSSFGPAGDLHACYRPSTVANYKVNHRAARTPYSAGRRCGLLEGDDWKISPPCVTFESSTESAMFGCSGLHGM
jgi:hypothetical protein